MIDEEDFTSFDECTSMTGTHVHHDNYNPNYVCDVYHNEQVKFLGFNLNTAHNSNSLSPQCMIKDQDYEALCPYLFWLPFDCIKHMLAFTTQWFQICITFLFASISSYLSLLPTSPIIMNLLPLTLCSSMSLC